MRTGLIVGGALLAVGLLAGCGGSKKAQSCTKDTDCGTRGEICQSGTCQERVCTSLGDCSGTDQICVAGEILGKDANKKFCTPKECGGTVTCADPLVCDGGLCMPKTGGEDAIVGTDESTGTDIPTGTDTPTGTDIPVVTNDKACKACSADADCGAGARCTPVGASKHCLTDCTSDDQCGKGFICYNASSAGKACLPVSYNCVACINDTPCGEGQCCDFLSGSCKACKDECKTCTYDFECGGDMRCFKKAASPSGVCVHECSTAACPDATKFTCAANDKGIKVCQPNDDNTCQTCPAGTFPSTDGTACWKCRNSADCGEKQTCDLATHECKVAGTCTAPMKDCGDGKCKECCSDADCQNGTGPCKADGKCTVSSDLCGGQCADPFPVCAVVGGSPQCVQCDPNNDTCAQIQAGCQCNTASYSCLDSTSGEVCQTTGGECSAICSSDADCPPGSSGEALSCYTSGAQGGICYSAAGTCDGMSSCCAAGQSCLDLIGLLMGGLMGGGGGLPGMPGGGLPTGGSGGYCSCDDTHPCLGGQACQDLSSILALLGPLLGLDTSSLTIPKMCGNPLGGLLGGGGLP